MSLGGFQSDIGSRPAAAPARRSSRPEPTVSIATRDSTQHRLTLNSLATRKSHAMTYIARPSVTSYVPCTMPMLMCHVRCLHDTEGCDLD